MPKPPTFKSQSYILSSPQGSTYIGPDARLFEEAHTYAINLGFALSAGRAIPQELLLYPNLLLSSSSSEPLEVLQALTRWLKILHSSLPIVERTEQS